MSNEDSEHTDIMSYDIPVPKVQALSHDTDELNFTDDYADIKGSTIWCNTLATSGLGFTAEEIRSLELSDDELLALGLTDEELLALRLRGEVYFIENTSDGKASDDTEGDDIPSARASLIITMDDEQEGRTESALVTRYTYDSFNRLLRYSDHTGSTCYSYNADGYRTAKYDYDDSSDVTRYLTIGGRNLFETSCAGNFTALNTYGTTLTSRASLAGGYEYQDIVYLYSAYGDVVLVADAQTGDRLASYAYDPFGNVILSGTSLASETIEATETIDASEESEADIQTAVSGAASSSSLDNPYGYRGYVKDDESGLYYLNARYYDSTSGRFLTADTFRGSKDDPLSLNRYVYCQSNPVRYTDPSGHIAVEAVLTFIAEELIKMGTAAAADFTFQLVGNYVFGHYIYENDQYTWGDAFDDVNGWQVAKASFWSLIPTGGKTTWKVVKAVGDGLTDALVEFLDDPNEYTWEEAIFDFAAGTASAFAGDWVEKYGPDLAAKGLKKIGVEDDLIESLTGVNLSKVVKDADPDVTESIIKSGNSSSKSFMNGKAGERELANMFGGKSQAYFKTTNGARYIDQLADGVAHESKVGYTTLTQFVKKQVLKEAEILERGDVDEVVWHFFKSGVTGKVGPSQPLADFLTENGIKYIIH